MTVDSSKRRNTVSPPDVKQLLTFTFKTTSKSRQQLYSEIISYLTKHHSSYNSQIAQHYNRSRQSVHVALTKLLEYNIIHKSGERSSCVSYRLNQDVKNYVKKITQSKENTNVKKSVGSVSDSCSSPSQPSSGSPDAVPSMSKNEINNSLVYR